MRIEELEAKLKFEESKYWEAMHVYHKGADVGKLTKSLERLFDIKEENEAEIAKFQSTVDNLKAELAYKRVNNPYGCKGKPKAKPPVSPRKPPAKREERTPRKTPSKKKGWSYTPVPVPSPQMGELPSWWTAETTRASVQFGAEGMRPFSVGT